MSILIRNGKVVTSATETIADILIEGDKISSIAPSITQKADRIIDAKGMWVIPGGVDPHVHMQLPTPAGLSADDFYTGSIAALFGGTTTIIDFVTPSRGQSIIETLRLRVEEASKSLTDYTFHVSPVEWSKEVASDIAHCIDMGFPSFKVYMAYKNSVGIDDNALYHIMHTVAQNGGLVLAHCELGDDIEVLRDFYASQGLTSPKYHALSRPARYEALAIKRAIDLADQTQCPLYIVHVSAADSVKHIVQAQKSGQPLFAETCPQYLILDESLYDGDTEKVIKYVMSPPLRTESDRESLWNAIANGTFQTVGTDHCPFNLKQKMAGRDDFRLIPNGAGGVEHRFALLYTHGVLTNKITPSRLVDIFSTQPAKVFGLYPQKGEVAVGSDADLVIWNPSQRGTISAKTHHQNADLNIYEGIETIGSAEIVVKGGVVVIEKGKLVNETRKGKLLKRST